MNERNEEKLVEIDVAHLEEVAGGALGARLPADDEDPGCFALPLA